MRYPVLYGIFMLLRARGLNLGTRDFLDGLEALQLYKDKFLPLQNMLRENTPSDNNRAVCVGRERLSLVWLLQTLWARNRREKQIIKEVITQDTGIADNALSLKLIAQLGADSVGWDFASLEREPEPLYPYQLHKEQVDAATASHENATAAAPAEAPVQHRPTTRATGVSLGIDTVDQRKGSNGEGTSTSFPGLLVQAIDGDYQMSVPVPVSGLWLNGLWRRLFRPIKRLDTNRIDIDKTIHQLASSGFLTEPAFADISVNTTKLLFLADVAEAMSPWIELERLLVKSLQSKMSRLNHVEVFYFNAAPGNTVYRKRNLHDPVRLDKLLQHHPHAIVFVLGEAGAATNRIPDAVLLRLKAFFELSRVYCKNPLIWINPMPACRWQACFQQLAKLQRQVYTSEFTQESLLQAIEYLRAEQR